MSDKLATQNISLLYHALMAEFYQTTPQNVTQHIREIYADGECEKEATCKQSLQVRQEGSRQVRHTIKHDRRYQQMHIDEASKDEKNMKNLENKIKISRGKK